MTRDQFSESDIAIIGMAGHFPGAADVDEFWQRVSSGDDCLRDLSPEDLSSRGVGARDINSTNYVRRAGMLDRVEDFDPEFFGISPRDAAIMDPQHRHFLECSWDALEAGGIVPERFNGAIGVFGGCGMNTYLVHNLLPNGDLVDELGWFLLRHTGNDKDFLTTTVSYRLDLRGPSISVQTACSTSLVAVHLAVQSLLSMECDVALAGGSTIEVPHGMGYEFRPGEILSPDGRCRAFDAESAGTVLASGAGVVALRRLTDAWDSGDPILAVIKGSAVNNDGARKVSYLAPSVDGHADAVKEALTVAGVNARDIQLLEAHGTGTPVGDPIEVAALTEAFGAFTDDTGFCRLSSTKPNIGHLDTAAGVASLIKVVQALRHETLPPIANHTGPSPLLDLERTPFVLSADRSPWPDHGPRRAGVSSLGVGGTNAHVVVEQAPHRNRPAPTTPEQVLLLSGRNSAAVSDLATRLADHLEAHPEVELADAAHTLATRRRHHRTRRVITATDRDHALEELRHPERHRAFDHECADTPPQILFMFPGGGSQYQGMAMGLDARFSTFHDVMSAGSAKVRELSGADLAAAIASSHPGDEMRRPTVSLPAVFITAVGLARQWMEWGIVPDAFIGHSLGEYVAAHLAGVITFDDALELVIARAALLEQTGVDAAMLVVPFGEIAARTFLTGDVSLAAVNTDHECVLAGTNARIAEIERQLKIAETPGVRVHLSAAAHSALLDPVLSEFRSIVSRTPLLAPQTRYASNLSGTWITDDQATDPEYWVQHFRSTVRFADNLRTALSVGPSVTVELGPGHVLSSYARQASSPPLGAITTLRHPRDEIDDSAYALHAFGQQWALGIDVDLAHVTGDDRTAVTLPTYPFQRQRCWIDPPSGQIGHGVAAQPPTELSSKPSVTTLSRVEKSAQMWWEPVWRSTPSPEAAEGPSRRWWMASEHMNPLADRVAEELAGRGCDVQRLDTALLVSKEASGGFENGDGIVIVADESSDPLDVDAATARWLDIGLTAVRSLCTGATSGHILAAITREAVGIDRPAERPTDAMALGLVGVTRQEYPDLDTIMIDTDGFEHAEIEAIVDELTATRTDDGVVGLRGGRRLTSSVSHVDSLIDADAPTALIAGGTYLITGGLGAIGHTIALDLARQGMKLVIVTSQVLPPPAERSDWLRNHSPEDSTSQRLRRLGAIEAAGAEVEVVVADLAESANVIVALDTAISAYGHLDGVVHAAGALCDRLIATVRPDEIETVIGVKARCAATLAAALPDRKIPLLVLVSSTSTVLTPEGQVAYVAANAVLDALSGQRGNLRIATIGYGVWSEIGMAKRSSEHRRLGLGTGDPVVHPVFEEVTRADDTTTVIGHLSSTDHWMLDEHRTLEGLAVLPASGHLELLFAALRIADVAQTPVTLSSVTIHEPLVVADGPPCAVRVCVSNHDDHAVVELESDGGPTSGWRLHTSARLERSPSPSAPPSHIDETTLVDVDPLAGNRDKLRLGARWSPTTRAMASGEITAGRIEADDRHRKDQALWRANPALVDAAIGLGAQIARASLDTDVLLVPIAFDRITLYSDVPPSFQVTANRSSAPGEASKVDLLISGGRGVTALHVEGLQFWPLAPGHRLGEGTGDITSSFHSLADLSEDLGILPKEGAELLAQFLSSGRPRLVASSVDLDQLRVATQGRTVAPNSHRSDTPPSVMSSTTLAERISVLWSDLLGLSDVDPDDDFFDLGGHSLTAIHLVAGLRREFGVRLQLSDILSAPTLTALIALVAQSTDVGHVQLGHAQIEHRDTDGPAPARSSLVPISAGGTSAPLFIVHGAGGNVMFLSSLSRALRGDRPVFGIQAAGVDPCDAPDPSIETMAARYVAELRAAHRGPYLLGGYSGGGTVALEMVRQLQGLGEEVSHLFLIDSVPHGRVWPPREEQIRNLLSNLRRSQGRSTVLAYIKRRWLVRRRRDWITDESTAVPEPSIVPTTHENDVVDLFDHFSTAALEYRLARYRVDATVIKADDVWPMQPHDYYWSQVIDGSLTVRTSPGNHLSMFSDELVPELAAAIDEALRPWRTDGTA